MTPRVLLLSCEQTPIASNSSCYTACLVPSGSSLVPRPSRVPVAANGGLFQLMHMDMSAQLPTVLFAGSKSTQLRWNSYPQIMVTLRYFFITQHSPPHPIQILTANSVCQSFWSGNHSKQWSVD